MAVATKDLLIGAATIPDGSSGNAAPQLERVKGSEANPAKHLLTARFDSATEEFLFWGFALPQDAHATPAPVMRIWWGSISAITSTNVVWRAALGAITPGDVDTPVEHALAAATTATSANNTTEAQRLISATITFANVDGIAAGDMVVVRLSRDAANASDTLAEDARLWIVTFEYTLA